MGEGAYKESLTLAAGESRGGREGVGKGTGLLVAVHLILFLRLLLLRRRRRRWSSGRRLHDHLLRDHGMSCARLRLLPRVRRLLVLVLLGDLLLFLRHLLLLLSHVLLLCHLRRWPLAAVRLSDALETLFVARLLLLINCLLLGRCASGHTCSRSPTTSAACCLLLLRLVFTQR